ncbi:MAG: ion transporter [Xanthomonadales bacterium]|jgi:voltage-gated sodium channel|nr:ion transporter [Xanthomonadales bacterium]
MERITRAALSGASGKRATPATGSLRSLVESPRFNQVVIAVIAVNAVTLGLSTSGRIMAVAGTLLDTLDRAALVFFTVELALRLWVYRARFFSGGWNLFDLAVVAISWIPTSGAFSVLRSLRILRVLRLISVVPQMRAVVGALFGALPGLGAIVAVLALVFYISAVMATQLFGATFPQWFGNVGTSFFSLFQIMTLESWSMGIARPVMTVYPYAWLFFVPFVIVTSFTVLNLFIALIVNSMQTVQAQELKRSSHTAEPARDERQQLLELMEELRREIRELKTRQAGEPLPPRT